MRSRTRRIATSAPIFAGAEHHQGAHDDAEAAVTNTARYVTRPVGVAMAGLLQPLGLGIPFLVAGVVKSAYDLALWRLFGSVQLPADTAAITGGSL